MVFRDKYNARVDTMSKTSASHKHFKTEPRPTDHKSPKISSHSTLPVSKKPQHLERPSHRGDTVRFPKEGLRDRIFPSRLLAVRLQKPKPVCPSKKYCKVPREVRSDSNTASATVPRRRHIHGTRNRRSQSPAKEHRELLESAGLDTSPRYQHRNYSASTRSGGSPAPRTKSQPSRPHSRHPKKQHPSRERTYPAYVCEKHKPLAKFDLGPAAAPRLSAGDGGPGPAAQDGGPAPPAGTEAAPRPQTVRSSHTIPLVLGRKLKPRDDPKRIPAEAAFGATIHRREYLLSLIHI